MSSVSSVGGSLHALFGQISGTDGATASSSAAATAPAAGSEPTSETQGHHHHKGGHKGVSSAVESSVTDALNHAQPGDDPNEVVKNAIAAALKKSQDGGDAQTAQQQGGAAGQAGQAAGGTSPSDFEALLKSHGVDPKQFQQDFQAATSETGNGGGVDYPTLFKSFPAGSTVDTTA